ncbi:Astrotactin-2 [Liparis tanakae]|uniref:Astrotactin-2 n=1 Tax=Liparis tanakae TaxID=230148 RepID=A0A4Z2IZ74_9TELE|nr:Astrotactin-2 [Liparis tanakae]
MDGLRGHSARLPLVNMRDRMEKQCAVEVGISVLKPSHWSTESNPVTLAPVFKCSMQLHLESDGRTAKAGLTDQKMVMIAIDPNTESVEDLMQRFQDSFRVPNTPTNMSHYQHVIHSSSTGRRRVPSHTRAVLNLHCRPKHSDYSCVSDAPGLLHNRPSLNNCQLNPSLGAGGRVDRPGPSFLLLTPAAGAPPGGVFGPQGESGSEPEDDSQMKFYTEQHRGRRRSKGHPHSPLNKVTLTLITISTCAIAIVYATQDACPLTVKVTLHVPEHFVADGSSFVVSMGSSLDVSNWLNPAKLTLYYQTNSSTQWVLDYCGQRTTEPCEQICDQDTGECSCHEGYSPDPVHKHLCVRSDWGRNEGSFYSLGQGLWLPVSKSFVVPPVELSINPIASCKTDVLVTEDPGEVSRTVKRMQSMPSVFGLVN